MAADACPPGWILMNSLCYYFSFTDNAFLRTWQRARDFCQIYGGDLAVIDSKDKELLKYNKQRDRLLDGTEASHRGRELDMGGWKKYWLREGNCGRCPPRWIIFNSSCYFFSYTESRTVRKNWPDSRANCITRGADLVVIDNEEEQTFVSDTIENMKISPHEWENGFWVGLRDTEIEGTWVWINNVTEVEQRYWMDGEPNDNGHRGEDCAAVHYKPTNPWKTRNDVICQGVVRHWICEMTSS
ncbi:hypothetical protein GBF38_021772 [Nibea albiflora]|uniref:Uncharacterized protein n=1 Tax=Nibea albiflora TaxID=240163 RepID=A0ACB7FGM6_NIBAL|nr:hypothetical protein GBF38_021772 [Nibea albiflora]